LARAKLVVDSGPTGAMPAGHCRWGGPAPPPRL